MMDKVKGFFMGVGTMVVVWFVQHILARLDTIESIIQMMYSRVG